MSPEILNHEKSKTLKFLDLIKERGISFDIDGVEALTSYPAVDLFNERFGFKYDCVKRVDDLKEYWTMVDWFAEIKKRYPDAVGDPKEESIKIWNDPGVQIGSATETGVFALNKFLAGHGIVPYRITSRQHYSLEPTLMWYKKNFPWVPREKILVRPAGVDGDEFKKNKAAELKIGFHLDDSVKHAEAITEAGAWVGLVTQPWNIHYTPPEGSKIIKPSLYVDRSAIIRAFLSLRDAVLVAQS